LLRPNIFPTEVGLGQSTHGKGRLFLIVLLLTPILLLVLGYMWAAELFASLRAKRLWSRRVSQLPAPITLAQQRSSETGTFSR
jgi:hypothetical protein